MKWCAELTLPISRSSARPCNSARLDVLIMPMPQPTQVKAASSSGTGASAPEATVAQTAPTAMNHEPITVTVWARRCCWSLPDTQAATDHPSVGQITANAANATEEPRAAFRYSGRKTLAPVPPDTARTPTMWM